ncbi:alpha/beta hydrolase [Geitlerinema sp. PCC 9228]|uniref:alpha/beta fold hydrolase n=1 Tax=Geitlerinema sp. PCC 9228 TaxID=111611 RepID=UPI0008F9A4A2|nr:alpha/beta hydrolase [Geitlerinema sp. PCC 9228]
MHIAVRNSRIQLSQGQIFWREIGSSDRPMVVFLHGSWQDSSQWLPALEKLGQQYHCLALDFLGFGDSERPKMHYCIDLEVRCLEEFLQTLNTEGIYLVGNSLGAWIGATYALQNPDQVKGLVLWQPIGVDLQLLKQGRDRNIWRKRLQLWLFQAIAPMARLLKRYSITKEIRRLKHELTEFRVPRMLLYQRRSAELQSELLQSRLGELQMPVFILYNDGDPTHIKTQSRAYGENIPHAQTQIIPSGSSLGNEPDPNLVLVHIDKFISQNEKKS